MMLRIWINGVDRGALSEQAATAWLHTMKQATPYADVIVELVPDYSLQSPQESSSLQGASR